MMTTTGAHRGPNRPRVVSSRPASRILYRTHRWMVTREGPFYLLSSIDAGTVIGLYGDEVREFEAAVRAMLGPTRGAKPLPYVLGIDRVCDRFMQKRGNECASTS